jgi:hypothetical protein
LVSACQNFEEVVVASGHLWLLLFKKPYCPWCADFDFEWQTAAYDLRAAPRVRLGEVNMRACPEVPRLGCTRSRVKAFARYWLLVDSSSRSRRRCVSGGAAVRGRLGADHRARSEPPVGSLRRRPVGVRYRGRGGRRPQPLEVKRVIPPQSLSASPPLSLFISLFFSNLPLHACAPLWRLRV